MASYRIDLTDEQEEFLDLYLSVHPLPPPNKREDYPGLIAKNFINSMMKRRDEFEALKKKIEEV